jgi:hypothetical protein
MQLRHIAACVLGAAACTGAPSLAYSAPFNVNLFNAATQITQSRTFYNSAFASLCNDQHMCVQLDSLSFDDDSGALQGYVSVIFYNDVSGAYSQITCSGTGYGKSTSLNAGNGNTTVSATLDPSAQGCTSTNISAPITVNIFGQPNGLQSQTATGVSTFVDPSGTFKQNFTSNLYIETFSGAIGSLSGPFPGTSVANRSTTRQRLK